MIELDFNSLADLVIAAMMRMTEQGRVAFAEHLCELAGLEIDGRDLYFDFRSKVLFTKPGSSRIDAGSVGLFLLHPRAPNGDRAVSAGSCPVTTPFEGRRHDRQGDAGGGNDVMVRDHFRISSAISSSASLSS